jgi:hypothetical protein
MKVGEHVKFNKKLPRLAHCRGFITAIDGMIVKMHWYEGADDGPMHTLLEHLELAGKAPQKILNKDSLIV